MQISLPRPLVNQMLAHAQQHAGQEICGLIARAGAQQLRYLAIDNRAPDPARRYCMDEQQLVESMREFRQRGEELFAIVHSHPTASAQPSAVDIAEANYPDVVYLIISLNTRGVLEMRAFKIAQGKVSAIEITI
jgi:proteasome lid subunit RPN8/RPN11